MTPLELYKALADPTRLRLIAILDHGEFTVQELVEILAMGQSRISRHLKILHAAGVVGVKREGTWGYYRLDPVNPLFKDHLPVLRARFDTLPHAGADAAAIVRLLARRRQRSQAFFESHASRWDQLVQDLLPTPDYQAKMLESMSPCATLVEIGVGTGVLLEPLSRKAQHLIGIDHAPAMLKTAHDRIVTLGLKNVELRLGEMEHLPLEGASVDGLVLHMVLHHASAPELVVREGARVLRPGTQITIVDLVRHPHEWVRERLADQWLGFTCEELESWCEHGGFEEIVCQEIAGKEEDYAVLICQARRRMTISG